MNQLTGPVKVVSERLGHGNPAFTIDTYQHILPGMKAEAVRMFERPMVLRLLPACQVPGPVTERVLGASREKI